VVLHNVVACIPGRSDRLPSAVRADEVVLFSAHYDHVGVGLPVAGDAVRNGADDDATGTTAVLLLAEAFARRRQPLPRTLVFACFSGEERGMRGSRAFAADPPVPLASIVANLNLEMLGRPDDCGVRRAWITGAELSDFAATAAAGLARAGIELAAHPQAPALFFASDNISLARHGVVAHSISAGSLHPDYHQPSDEVDKLDLEHMTAVIRGLYEAGIEFATHPERPQWNDQGRATLQAGGRGR
jgi:Zn-dependent M28 family amino/carboxypeptidase